MKAQAESTSFVFVNRRLRRQLLKQRLCILQIARVEPFGEPAVYRSKQIASRIPLAWSRQRRAMLIAARNSQDLACC